MWNLKSKEVKLQDKHSDENILAAMNVFHKHKPAPHFELDTSSTA